MYLCTLIENSCPGRIGPTIFSTENQAGLRICRPRRKVRWRELPDLADLTEIRNTRRDYEFRIATGQPGRRQR
jgi:hypothetical protein